MNSATLIRGARERAGLSLRDLALRASTSHSTLAAYEQGRKIPNVNTLDRILRAAGFAVDVTLSPRIGAEEGDRAARGRELIEVLELAAMFPADHEQTLNFPKFGSAA